MKTARKTALAGARVHPIAPYLVILLGFALQTGYLVELRAMLPDSFTAAPFCGVDAVAHWQRADGLLDGSIPGENVYYFTPLYPFYLALLKQFFGPSYLLSIYLQILLQMVGLAALYGLGRRLFSPLAGLLAALGLATYSDYLYYIPCSDQALLTTPTLTLALFFLLQSDPKQRQQQAHFSRLATASPLLAGLAFTVAILSRPTVLMVMPVVVLWLWWRRRSWASLTVSLMALLGPIVLGIAPLTWHNYHISGQFVLMSNNFGVNLFTGNNPDAYGLDSLAHAQNQPAVLRFLEVVHQVEQGQTSYGREVLHYWRTQPMDALALTVRKIWLWLGEPMPPLVSPYFPLHAHQSPLLSLLPLTWQAIVILALFSLMTVRPRSWSGLSLLWLVYTVFSLFTILFYIQLRFRLPLMPFVMLQAAALLAIAPHWAERQPARFVIILGLMLIASPLVPGLAIMVIIYLALGWVGLMRPPSHKLYPTVAILLYLLATVLWQQLTPIGTVSQPMDHYLGPKIAGTMSVGQTFQMDCDRLHEIELTFGTFNPLPRPPVTFHLQSKTDQTLFHEETIDASTIQDYQRHRFTFPEIDGSAGQRFAFYLTAPEATTNNALTVRGYSDTPLDYYPDGVALVGGEGQQHPFQADIAFTARCNLSWWEKLWRFLTT